MIKMAKLISPFSACLLCIAGLVPLTTAIASVTANVTLVNTGPEIESDWTSIYYHKKPLLLGNDGGAASGGIRAWSLESAAPLSQVKHLTPGRTKLLTVAYDVGDRDVLVTIAMTDSIIRLYDLPTFAEIKSARSKALGDWSALCAWRSETDNQYFYLLGKSIGIQFLLRERKGEPEILKVCLFFCPAPFRPFFQTPCCLWSPQIKPHL